jgi:hypothetical protein
MRLQRVAPQVGEGSGRPASVSLLLPCRQPRERRVLDRLDANNHLKRL